MVTGFGEHTRGVGGVQLPGVPDSKRPDSPNGQQEDDRKHQSIERGGPVQHRGERNLGSGLSP